MNTLIQQQQQRGIEANLRRRLDMMMMGYSCLRRKMKKMSPYLLMIFSQFAIAGYTILSKVIFTDLGINPLVFNFYQFMVAATFMAPLAFFFERKSRPPLTLSITCWIFLLALLGITLFQNLFSASLYYISSTSASAISNLIPAFTYILSVLSAQEAAELNRLRGIGKLFGTLLSILGTFTLIFWRNIIVRSTFVGSSINISIGYISATLGVFSVSIWIVLQCPVTAKYPAELSLTAISYFFGAMQTFIIASLFTSNSEWNFNWNLELFNIVFGGVVVSGIGSFICTWCARKKGPLFVAVFAPLNLLLTAFMERLILGTAMDFGCVLGSLMIVGGLYMFLWSKSKEEADGSNDADDVDDNQSINTPLLLNQESRPLIFQC